tara:strand:- start:49 stop:810 length:762 start_codon:yes stop_codon:yes gene_type:complete
MPINSKNISSNDIQLYIEDDISYDKKKFILEIENKTINGKKLTSDETKILKELNVLRNVDNFFVEAINNQPSIPKELQNEIDQTITLLSTKEPSFINNFLNIKHLVSSGIGALAAVAAMMFFTISSTNLAYRSLIENLSLKNTQWEMTEHFAYQLNIFNEDGIFERSIKPGGNVSLNEKIEINILPIKSINLEIKYQKTENKDLSLIGYKQIEKGKQFSSNKLSFDATDLTSDNQIMFYSYNEKLFDININVQ